MKQFDCYESEAKPRSRKLLWVLLLMGVPIASILLLAISPSLRFSTESFGKKSTLVAPYRYPFSQSLRDNNSPTSLVQKEIAFYQERVRRDPKGGLELASLARAYLKMARATEEGSWYLLGEQAARRSLANLPFDNNGAVLVLARVAQARHDFSEAIRLAKYKSLQKGYGNQAALARVDLDSHFAITFATD